MGFPRIQMLIILTLRLLVSFNYVLARTLFDEAYNYILMWSHLYYVVITSVLVQVIWIVDVIVFIYKDKVGDEMFLNYFTTSMIVQAIIIYGLGVMFSLILSLSPYFQDLIQSNNAINSDLLKWTIICTVFIWFTFIVYIAMIGRIFYVRGKDQSNKIEEPSKAQ